MTVRKIAELWNKGLHFYTGGFTRYEQQKTERRAQLQSAYDNQQDKIRQLESFINRFRAQATKAKQVQSRIKELEKNRKDRKYPRKRRRSTSVFPSPNPAVASWLEFRKVLLKATGITLFFQTWISSSERGDRVALVGVNGAGKSTLIKILAGAEPVSAGEYTLNHNAQPDYFAQDQYKELDQQARMIDDLGMVAPRASNTELRSILGCFLFSEDDVFKTIGVLSGGERNRYALARMLMVPSNFMLLDEPTNHLDMRAKDVLLNSLQEYNGTVVFVSHDRYFIDKLATRIIEVENGRVQVYPGNYEDYQWRKQGGGQSASSDEPLTPVTAESVPETASEPAKPSERRLNPIKLRQMRERRHEIEEDVTRMEAEIADYEAAFAHFVNVEETQRISDLLHARRADLESLLMEWEEVAQSIEANS